VKLGASRLADSGAPVVTATSPITGDDDAEHFGEIDVFEALGHAAMPWPANDDGHAEGLVARDVGNMSACQIGARDNRAAKIYGKLGPGDTAMFSTGPEQAAQVLCKEKSRTVALLTKDTAGKDIGFMLDGSKDRSQWFVKGAQIMLGDDGSILIKEKGGAGIHLKDGNLIFYGTPLMGKGVGPNVYFMLGPVAGSLGGAAASPMVACQGMFAGT
jgi:hypothetical protein